MKVLEIKSLSRKSSVGLFGLACLQQRAGWLAAKAYSAGRWLGGGAGGCRLTPTQSAVLDVDRGIAALEEEQHQVLICEHLTWPWSWTPASEPASRGAAARLIYWQCFTIWCLPLMWAEFRFVLFEQIMSAYLKAVWLCSGIIPPLYMIKAFVGLMHMMGNVQ